MIGPERKLVDEAIHEARARGYMSGWRPDTCVRGRVLLVLCQKRRPVSLGTTTEAWSIEIMRHQGEATVVQTLELLFGDFNAFYCTRK